MSFLGIALSKQKNGRYAKIVVGNSANGDGPENCNILETGDGSAIRSACIEAQQAWDAHGIETEILLLEGRYEIPYGQRFTTGVANVRGIDPDLVTIVCPTNTGGSQNVCTVSDGTTLSCVTVELTANGSDIGDATTGTDYIAVYIENGGTFRDSRFVYNGADPSMTFAVCGYYGSGDPSRITIDNIIGESATDELFTVVYIGSSDGELVSLQGPADVVSVSNITAVNEGDPASGSCAVTMQTHANVSNVRAVGFPSALIHSAAYTDDATSVPMFTISGIHTTNAGLTHQSPVQFHFQSDVSTAMNNILMSDIRTMSDDVAAGGDISEFGMDIRFQGITAYSTQISGFKFIGASHSKGFFRLAAHDNAAVSWTTINGVKTDGTISLETENGFTTPFQRVVIADVVADAITLTDAYCEDMSVVAGVASSLTVGPNCNRTVIGGSLQCSNITDNGVDTAIVSKCHTSASSPTTGDDRTKGYRPTDQWLDTVAHKLYVCETNGVGTALWTILN